MPTEEYSGVI